MTREELQTAVTEYSQIRQEKVQHLLDDIAKLSLEDALYLIHVINQDLVFWNAQRFFNLKKAQNDVKELV